MTAGATRARIKALLPEPVVNWVKRRKQSRWQAELKTRIADALRPDDIFVVGHPKSGNTWLTYMLSILARQDFDRQINLANIGQFAPTMHARDRAVLDHESLPSPRIFRNEGPVFPDLYPRTIFIVRDPRSVLVSYYHHCVHDTGDTDWSIEAFVDEVLTEGFPFGPGLFGGY